MRHHTDWERIHQSLSAVYWPRGWHACLQAAIRSATKSFHFTFSLSSIIRLRATSVGRLGERWVTRHVWRGWRRPSKDREQGDGGTLVDIRPASLIVRWLAAATPAGQTRPVLTSRETDHKVPGRPRPSTLTKTSATRTVAGAYVIACVVR